MEHFKGINDQERFQNEMMQRTRRQTELLEQIAQLLQSNSVEPISATDVLELEQKQKRPYNRRNKTDEHNS